MGKEKSCLPCRPISISNRRKLIIGIAVSVERKPIPHAWETITETQRRCTVARVCSVPLMLWFSLLMRLRINVCQMNG